MLQVTQTEEISRRISSRFLSRACGAYEGGEGGAQGSGGET